MVLITVMCQKSKHGGNYAQALTSTVSGGYIFYSPGSVKERNKAVVLYVLSRDPLEFADSQFLHKAAKSMVTELIIIIPKCPHVLVENFQVACKQTNKKDENCWKLKHIQTEHQISHTCPPRRKIPQKPLGIKSIEM